MPTSTFTNLKAKKKEAVTDALINEFSYYPLKDAQVARIIKDAGIARGAFYKYFDDINDAYRYVFHLALADFHMGFARMIGDNFALDKFINSLDSFIDQVVNSRYYQLLKLHYLFNESSYRQNSMAGLTREAELPATTWAVSTLSHEAVKELLVFPDKKDFIIQRLKENLQHLS